jgi:Fis family transcriptional regulator
LQKTISNNPSSLSEHVTKTLEDYFSILENEIPSDVYQMVTQQVEKPMIEFVLKKNNYNQSRTAEMLGINRNTLRKKIQQHQIKK